MINLFALVASIVLCLYLVAGTDMSRGWKALAAGLTGGALAIQFGHLDVGFLALPILMQVFVSIWGLLHLRLETA